MSPLTLALLVAALGLGSFGRASAQDFSHTLTGDWWGLRPALLERGVRLEPFFTAEAFGTLAGGVQRRATYLDDIDLRLTLDAEPRLGWRGLTVFVHGLGTHGGDPSELVGDAQGVSEIAAPARWRWHEVWVEQKLLDGRVSLRVGRYDLNTEFYALTTAALFVNSSFGIGPEFAQSGRGGPSIFPDTALGGRLDVHPADGLVLRAAILDGVPVDVRRADGSRRVFAGEDGLLLVGEVSYLPELGKIALGGWVYTATFDDQSRVDRRGRPERHHGSGGVYLVGEHTLHRDDREGSQRRVTVFGQLGLGDGRVNRFASYTGGGLVVVDPLARGAGDQVGLGVAAAHNGAGYLQAQRRAGTPAETSEVTLELTYRAPLTPWLHVQPDLQYVINPGTDPALRDAVVVAVRVDLAF